MAKPDRADSRQYDEWLDKAGGDLLCARALREDDRCYDGAGFHCQQAIEKALKAYILLRSGRLHDGHNLTWLCRQALRYDRKFSDWFDESAALTHCYIETRYPSDLYEAFDYARVRQAYTMAYEMFMFICGQIDAHFERASRFSGFAREKESPAESIRSRKPSD
ncbi:MAG: HEPN domain-containing protein [Provencibacterium sp.]|nr:HEPN domain-containing protein [Provencibacterium sp.]